MTLCSEKFCPTFYYRFRLIQPRFSASGQRSRRSGQRDNEMANDFDSYGLLTPHKSCPHTFYFRFSVEISDYFLSRWVSEIGTRERPDYDLATDLDSIEQFVAVILYLHFPLDSALIIICCVWLTESAPECVAVVTWLLISNVINHRIGGNSTVVNTSD